MALTIPQLKYGVGHRFFVPRCYHRVEYIEKEIDGETWRRPEMYYIPVVKEKIVRSITINIDYNNRIKTEYNVIDVESIPEANIKKRMVLPSRYSVKDITSYTYEEAMAIAESYAAKQEPYFGNHGEDWYDGEEE